MADFGRAKTWGNETLEPADLNAEFDNIISNVTSGGINSANIDLTGTYAWSGAHTHTATVTVGVDDTGHDVKFFGAAAGAFALWDESANLLDLRGATAAGPGHLKLTTGELTVVDGDILGRIDFQAPLESDGTDSTLVAASIWAEADDTFGTALNDTDLVFAVAESETALERMRLSYDGTTVGLSFSGVAAIDTGGNNNLTLNSGTASVVTTGNVVSDTDSTDDLGTTSVRWANVYTDSIGDTGQDLTVAATTVNLPSGHVFDWNSADVTLTHSSNTLALAGGGMTVSGDFVVDTTTLAVDATLNVVGIGISGQSNQRLSIKSPGGGTCLNVIESGSTQLVATLSEDSGDSAGVFRLYDGANTVTVKLDGAGDTLFNGGNVFIGDSANANTTQGLTVNQGANDDELFAGKSSDIAHGLTDQSETDTYFLVKKGNATLGGVRMSALAEDAAATNVYSLVAFGGTADTTKTTAGQALMTMEAYEHDGANALANITADGNIFGVRAYVGGSAIMRFMVDEDADIFAAVADTVTAFDAYDDTALVAAYDAATAPDSVIRTDFEDFAKYNESDLVKAKILGAPLKEGGMLNVTQLQRLHNGAIRQLARENKQLSAELIDLRNKMLLLEERTN